MNVLTQLKINRTKCEDRLAHAEKALTSAQYPFEMSRAQVAVTKAQQSLKLVIREIVAEEERQDADECAYLDI